MSKARRSSPLTRQLEQAHRWLDQGRAAEARDLLADLEGRHPDRLDLLTLRLAADHALGEPVSPACRRLLALAPDDDRPRQLLALEQMDRGRFALALREFRKFRGPLHERVQGTLAEIERDMAVRQSDLALPAGDEGFRLLALLEEADAFREEEQFELAVACVREVLEALPGHELALVRLATTLWMHASLPEVEAHLDAALARVPDSGPLLVQKIRVLLARDGQEEARALAERLGTVDPNRPGIRVAQAVAWTEVGEFARVEAREDLPLLHQLAGVASLRLGRPEEARRHWRKAPDLPEAAKNLADLDVPAAERGGPWLHSPALVLPRALCRAIEKGDPQTVLRENPGLPGALRALMQNGGPEGRRLAVSFALACPDPEVTRVLADYATGDLGPDASRLSSAMVCVQRGALAPGRARMWVAGRWEDVHLVRCTPRSGPRLDGPAKAVRLVQRADALNVEGRHEEAEQVAREALALKPGDPQLLVEVATCLFMQGRHAETESLLAGVLAQEPPFAAAWILAALVDLASGRPEAARARVDRLEEFPDLSGGELCAYAQARIELALQAGQREEARAWALLGDWADPRAGLGALVPSPK